MKKITSFLILFSFFSTVQIVAQHNTKPKRAIILELHFKNEEKPEIFELPIDLYEVRSGAGIGGGGNSSYCCECDKSKLPPSFYFNSFYGSVVRKNKANLFLSIDVNETCKIRRKFSVISDKSTKIKTNCNVDLIAYYGYESEKEEN